MYRKGIIMKKLFLLILFSTLLFARVTNPLHGTVSDPSSTANDIINDVIGNKTDSHFGGSNADNSIYSYLKSLDEDRHAVSIVTPSLSAGVTVTSAGGAWTLGAAVTMLPADATTSDFDLHWINVENTSEEGTYEIHLFDDGVLITPIRVIVTGTPDDRVSVPRGIKTPKCNAGSVITAKVAHSAGGSETIDISLVFHFY